MTRGGLAIVLAVTGALLLGVVGVRVLSVPSVPLTERATVLPSAAELAPFSLVDDRGGQIGPAAFRDRWTLVFFGFTRCPDVCPTTLAVLARARRALDDLAPAQRPDVLFVSVDPEHDDPASLGAYVRFFEPSFSAAWGPEVELAAAAAAFGVGYARIPLPDGGYTMEHGSSIFLVGPAGGIVAFMPAPHDAELIARDYRSIVAGSSARWRLP